MRYLYGRPIRSPNTHITPTHNNLLSDTPAEDPHQVSPYSAEKNLCASVVKNPRTPIRQTATIQSPPIPASRISSIHRALTTESRPLLRQPQIARLPKKHFSRQLPPTSLCANKPRPHFGMGGSTRPSIMPQLQIATILGTKRQSNGSQSALKTAVNLGENGSHLALRSRSIGSQPFAIDSQMAVSRHSNGGFVPTYGRQTTEAKTTRYRHRHPRFTPLSGINTGTPPPRARGSPLSLNDAPETGRASDWCFRSASSAAHPIAPA